jgi:peptidylprolyl isomerase
MPRILAVLAGALVALGGCTAVPGADPSVPSISDIVVGRDDAGSPTIDSPVGLEFAKSQSRVEWEGEGEDLVEGGPLLLDLYSVSLETGEVLANTYADLPKSFLLAPELLGDDLFGALSGHRVGARLLLVTPEDPLAPAHGAIAIVVDVLPERALGVEQPTRADLPVVVVGRHGEPSVSFLDDYEAPAELVAYTLIQGDGPQIKTGSRVLVNYLEISSTTREVLESTWPLEFAPWGFVIGEGALPTGLEQSLIDVNQGSQLIVSVPPGDAYGEDTLIFVVDVLAVRNPS